MHARPTSPAAVRASRASPGYPAHSALLSEEDLGLGAARLARARTESYGKSRAVERTSRLALTARTLSSRSASVSPPSGSRRAPACTPRRLVRVPPRLEADLLQDQDGSRLDRDEPQLRA